MDIEMRHTLSLDNRQALSATGIDDVESFDDQQVTALCSSTKLIIRGEGLHIDELSTENGILRVGGKINSFAYEEKISGKSIYKKLFGS